MKKLKQFLSSDRFFALFFLICCLFCFLGLFVDIVFDIFPLKVYILYSVCSLFYLYLSDWFSSKSQEASK